MTEEATLFSGWVILELMGHRRLAGFMTEQEIAGVGFLRIDLPEDNDHVPATQFYAPSSVYAITPTTEEVARAVAQHGRPEPVQRWELTPPKPPILGNRHYVQVPDDDNPDGGSEPPY